MAIGQAVSASASFIQFPPGTAATLASGITPAWAKTPSQVEGTIVDGVLKVHDHSKMPGVFTEGTPREGGGHQANI